MTQSVHKYEDKRLQNKVLFLNLSIYLSKNDVSKAKRSWSGDKIIGALGAQGDLAEKLKSKARLGLNAYKLHTDANIIRYLALAFRHLSIHS